MLNWWKATLNPNWFHGRGKRPPFFEGWYYKLIDREQRHKLAVIPGMILSGEPHAFIQVLDGTRKTSQYIRFPLDQFVSEPDRFAIHVAGNFFSVDGFSLNIERPDFSISGEVAFSTPKPWPVSLASPGIMGWYAWVPTMECYHGVLSLDHSITGSLSLNGQAMDFSGGKGYAEKDWGRSFPSAYIWMQTNHFSQAGVSLTASIAMIPWQFTRFRGFIVGLLLQGKLYRFATYTRATSENLQVNGKRVEWQLLGKTQGHLHRLSLVATQADATDLAGPSTHDMGKRIPESLNARIEVRLSRVEKGREVEIFADVGSSGGLEIFNVEQELLD